MIDIKLFIINMFCIIGASFLVYILLTYFKVTGDKTYISIFIGIIIVLAFYCWINIPELACNICSKSFETMANFNNDIPKVISEQDGLIIPENANATINTDINLIKFLKYGHLSKQLREALEWQTKNGGTNPPPSYTATSQIVSPYSDVVIAVDPVLLLTQVPTQEIVVTQPTETVIIKEDFSDNNTKLILFYSPHCGFCKEFMKKGGLWERVKKDLNGKIEIIEVNNDVNPQMVREFNVSYFPCLMKVKNNTVIEFDDDREYDDIIEFALE